MIENIKQADTICKIINILAEAGITADEGRHILRNVNRVIEARAIQPMCPDEKENNRLLSKMINEPGNRMRKAQISYCGDCDEDECDEEQKW